MDALVDCSFMPTFSWGVNNGSCRTRTDRARTPADLPRAARTQFKPAQYTCGVARVTEEGRLDYGGYGQQCKQGHVTRTVGFLPERKKKKRSLQIYFTNALVASAVSGRRAVWKMAGRYMRCICSSTGTRGIGDQINSRSRLKENWPDGREPSRCTWRRVSGRSRQNSEDMCAFSAPTRSRSRCSKT